jgi:hypothetical protein
LFFGHRRWHSLIIIGIITIIRFTAAIFICGMILGLYGRVCGVLIVKIIFKEFDDITIFINANSLSRLD